MATPQGDIAGQSELVLPGRGAGRHRRRIVRWALVAFAIALLGGGLAAYLAYLGMREDAVRASAFAARTGCACRFVEGRPLEQCREAIAVETTGRPGQLLQLSESADPKAITASIPLLASQIATFDEGPGCLLAPWQE